jgi:hypothetical protein
VRIRLVSGGQTGVDRAALDLALAREWPCGGWCPRGRWAEDGRLPSRYPLRETPLEAYPQRTEWNVRDSDGTLILHRGALRGGTALTVRLARQQRRPLLKIDLLRPPLPLVFQRWVEANGIAVLNVAGPRESEAPGIYVQAQAQLAALLEPMALDTAS